MADFKLILYDIVRRRAKTAPKTYWDLGNSLGKAGHGAYCWKVMTARFANRKIPWAQQHEIMQLLGKIFQPDNKVAVAANW